MSEYKCSKCKKQLEASDAYEYRGAVACDECFDDVIAARDYQRNEIISEEDARLTPLKGMNLDPKDVIGRANREILSTQIEIASKESARLKDYEGRL